MRQKKLKQLRKLSNYKCHAKPVYKGKAHGVREKIDNVRAKVNGKLIELPFARKYQAITIVNESKMQYNLAKKIYNELSKSFGSKEKS